MNPRQVLPATPFVGGAQLGSYGRGTHVLMRQHEFPDTYDPPLDRMTGDDHDRVQSRDIRRASDCIRKHTGSGDMGLGYWARSAKAADVLAFCKEFLQADPAVEWTGFRILGTVNRASGYVVWSIGLFAKHPSTDTKVYSGENAPNVARPKQTPVQSVNGIFLVESDDGDESDPVWR